MLPPRRAVPLLAALAVFLPCWNGAAAPQAAPAEQPAPGTSGKVVAGAGRHLWMAEASPELDFRAAQRFCARLARERARAVSAPAPAGGWRVPELGELLTSPLWNLPLADGPYALWTATVPDGRPGQRWVVDLAKRAFASRPEGASAQLRVVCVSSGLR